MQKIRARIASMDPVLLCTALVLLVRTVLFLGVAPTISADSAGYINPDGFAIFSLVTDELRTPVYLLFIEIFQRMTPDHFLTLIVWAQFLISCLACVLLYRTFRLFSIEKRLAALLFAAYSLCVTSYGWDGFILTESLSLSLCTVFVYCLARYIHTCNGLNAAAAAGVLFLLVFLRPTSLALLPVALGFFVIFPLVRKLGAKQFLLATLPILAVAVLTFFYTQLYHKQHGISSMSVTLVHQQIVMVVQDGFHLDNPDTEMTEFISERAAQGGSLLKVAQATREAFGNQRTSEYASVSIRAHFFPYLTHRLYELVRNIPSGFEGYPQWNGGLVGALSGLVRLVFGSILLPLRFGNGLQACILSAALFVWMLLRKKQFSFVHLGIVFCITVIYLSSVWGTYESFGRTSLQVVPFIVLSFALGANQLLQTIRKRAVIPSE